jgi:hypothetical protein
MTDKGMALLQELVFFAKDLQNNSGGHVIFDFHGHVECVGIRVWKSGWKSENCPVCRADRNNDPDYEKRLYLDGHLFNETEIDAVIRDLDEMRMELFTAINAGKLSEEGG